MHLCKLVSRRPVAHSDIRLEKVGSTRYRVITAVRCLYMAGGSGGSSCRPPMTNIGSISINLARFQTFLWLVFRLAHFGTMATKQSLPHLPDPEDVKLRILIIGRANAGKTSILQRVCDTTKSPVIYRRDQSGTHKKVRPRSQSHFRSHRPARLNSTLQWRSGRAGLILVVDD
jgi:hypothetical protein